MSSLRRTLSVLVLVLAFAGFMTGQALASTACGKVYSYAGFDAAHRAFGVRVSLVPLAAPAVKWGHVAAWVGVGGVGLGPHGTTEWIQVGLAAYPDSTASELYYEIARPGQDPQEFQVKASVAVGEAHQVAVLEMAHHRSWWRVWVDNQPVSKPVFLPHSHGQWWPQASAESWNGGTGACNGYAYQFDHPAVATHAGGIWRPLRHGVSYHDPGYVFLRRSRFSFQTVASSLESALRPVVQVQTIVSGVPTGIRAASLRIVALRNRMQPWDM